LFSLPGTPVLYYGDEIGMGDNVYLGDRDGVRTPMQWSPDRNAGFSSTNPQRLYLPTILDPEYHYESVNVETQRRNTSSLFWFTKRMINLRKKYKAFGRGDLKFLNVENPKVLAFTRTYDDETLLIVVNLSKYSQPAEIDLTDYKGFTPVEAFSRNSFPAVPETGSYFFTLAPHDYQWFVLEKVRPDALERGALPTITVKTLNDLTNKRTRELLETKVLPAYLDRMDWFNGRGQKLYGVTITNYGRIYHNDSRSYIVLVEVAYERGLPETYQLALSFVGEDQADNLTESCPQAVLANVKVGEDEGVLCDGLYSTELHQALIAQMVGNQSNTESDHNIVFQSTSALDTFVQEHTDIKTRLVASGPNYTSISYENCYLLKMYRKIDGPINPDAEINRYLSETAGFAYVPAFAGTVELEAENDRIMLGMMEVMVPNHGDGHSFMLERINNFMERILARERSQLDPMDRRGKLTLPFPSEELPADMRELLGERAAQQARLMGTRIGEMHLALAAAKNLKDFTPESFSLHYQRSLFSGMQSLVRESFQTQQRSLKQLPEDIRPEVEKMLGRKEELLEVLKRIYVKKLEATKIRIHGNLQLENILLTGKDVSVQDFGGDPSRSYGERRLKRSPLRDVANIIRSFYYVAYEGFLNNVQVTPEETKNLLPFADFWAHYMSGFFMHAYLETVENSAFIPNDSQDLQMMVETYMLEQAIADLGKEVQQRPAVVQVPLRIINSILG
jgi:maltose alpha-D-glucosyltransferase/alpha-amylase